MREATIRNCPFCGGSDLLIDDISPRVWSVVCKPCEAIGPSRDDQERAVKAGNERPGERAAVHRVLDEALNSGDGVYRP